MGPMMPPGKYTVVFSAGSYNARQPLEVVEDPRVLASGVTDAEIVALTQGQSFARSRSDFAVTTGELADFQALAPAFAAQKITRLERF